MNVLRYGVCDALPLRHPYLRFTHFSLGPSFKKLGVPPSGSGPAYMPTLRFHLYCCSYVMKPDGCRANHIVIEKKHDLTVKKH